MKKIITLLSIFFTFFIFSIKAQNAVTLSQLIDLASAKTLSAFDTKVRSLGYSFDTREVGEKSTLSRYTKTIETRTKYYTFILSYDDFGDGKPVINFTSSSNAVPNLISNIKKQAAQQNFSETTDDCSSGDASSVTFCYVSPKYRLYIFDTSIREDGSSYNKYRIRIFKR